MIHDSFLYFLHIFTLIVCVGIGTFEVYVHGKKMWLDYKELKRHKKQLDRPTSPQRPGI